MEGGQDEWGGGGVRGEVKGKVKVPRSLPLS